MPLSTHSVRCELHETLPFANLKEGMCEEDDLRHIAGRASEPARLGLNGRERRAVRVGDAPVIAAGVGDCGPSVLGIAPRVGYIAPCVLDIAPCVGHRPCRVLPHGTITHRG